jgi:hypothetical protein
MGVRWALVGLGACIVGAGMEACSSTGPKNYSLVGNWVGSGSALDGSLVTVTQVEGDTVFMQPRLKVRWCFITPTTPINLVARGRPSLATL